MIVLGMLLLVVIGIFFGLGRISLEKQTEEQEGRSLTQSPEIKPVRDYVSACLSTVGREGLRLLGLQGGVLYRSQGGLVEDFRQEQRGTLYLPLERSQVAYGIHPPRFPAPPHSHRVPEYPYATFPYADWPQKTISSAGTFGLSTLPPLSASEGPVSLEAQLEQYVSVALPSCLELDSFEEDGFRFSTGEPAVSVAFTDAGTDFLAAYPIDVTLPATGEQVRLERFTATHPVRLKAIHRFASALIRLDVSDVTFDPGTGADGPFSVSLLQDAWEQDDVIRIRDSRSSLGGQPYELRFARHNRAPALYHLSPDTISLENGKEVNTSIILPPYLDEYTAADPDEDAVSFSFTVESQAGNPALPVTLGVDRMVVRVTASDGELEDYQLITIQNLGDIAPSYCPIHPQGCYDRAMNHTGQKSIQTGGEVRYTPVQFCTDEEGCECTQQFRLDMAALQQDGDDSAGACGCFEASDWLDERGCCGDDAGDCGAVEEGSLCYMASSNSFAEWREADRHRHDVSYLSCNDDEYLSDGTQWLECEEGTTRILSLGGHDFLCRGTPGRDQWAECCGDTACNSDGALGIIWHRDALGDQLGVNTIDTHDGATYRCNKDETFTQI